MEREQETPSVVPLEPDQLDAAAEMLARAFHDDPTSEYLFPDPSTRRRHVAWSMRCLVRFALRYGVVETTPGVDGLAAWYRSDVGQMTAMRMLRCGMWSAPRLGLRGWWRVFRILRATHATRTRLAPSTHWYLLLLAVDPAHQRTGLGSLLLRRGIERAERDGLECRLETATDEAARFYAKHGFHVAGQARILGSLVDIRTLVRSPRG